MKIFVTGANGQLGSDVVAEALSRGIEAVGSDINDLDLTDAEAVAVRLSESAPDAVIHCAAWTAVDAAEDECNREKVWAANVRGTENIARYCGENGCKLIYVSTDYVFDGSGSVPWKPDDECKPISVYGKTKFEGEKAAERRCAKLFIVRTAWVFGKNGGNFVKKMLELAKTRGAVSVVDDQIGAPTYTRDLARLLADMAESEKYGKYHATNSGDYVSWHGFAEEIFKQAARTDGDYAKTRLTAVKSDQFPSKAKRPFNSRLDMSKLAENGFEPLPDWKSATARFLEEWLNEN